MQDIITHLHRFARPLFLAGVFYRLIAVVLLTPLVGGLATVFIAASGRSTIINEEVAAFLLEPLGLVTLVLTGIGGLALIALEQACLMAIAIRGRRTAVHGALDALKFALPKFPLIVGLAGRIVLRALLLIIPFLALAGLVYLRLLTDHDINYYVAERPREFRWAVAIVALMGLGAAVVLIRLVASVVLSLPILLFETRSPRESLRESILRIRGQRRRIILNSLIWSVVVIVVSIVTTALFLWLGRLLAPATGFNLTLLTLFFGGLFLSFSLAQLLISIAAAASFSLLVVKWYAGLSPRMTESSLKPAAGLGDTLSAKTRFSLRVVAGAGLTALVLALLTGRLLLSGVAMDDRSEIMAHRGASAAAPENTMAAVEKAIVDGAHWVEIDVQRTRDDHVVVVHDKDLMRIGGAPVVVSESLLRDVVSVDVGTWFGPNFSDQRIPTLGDVLHRCKAAIKVNIELKYYQWDERLARRVIDIVEKTAMQKDVAVMSLSAQAVRQVKELRPDWRVGLLSATALTDLVKVPCDFLAVHSRMATPKFVRRVHAAGKSLCVWTVNDAVGMLRMFDRGVDVLITDEPALAARLLQERKKLESAERLLMATGLMIVGQPQHLDPATDGF